MSGIGYSSFQDPRLQPPDPDDRWEAIAERLEGAYGTGDKLREFVESELWDFDFFGAVADIYEGHPDDIAVASERLIRRLLGQVERRVIKQAHEDAEAEVERMDDQSERDHGEAMAARLEDAA